MLSRLEEIRSDVFSSPKDTELMLWWFRFLGARLKAVSCRATGAKYVQRAENS